MQTRLQIGVDGSDHALAAVAYVGGIAAEVDTMFIRLLHVVPPVPPWLHDTGVSYEPFGGHVPEHFPDQLETWRGNQQKRAKRILEQARTVLIEHGASPARVETATEEGASQRPSRELRMSAQRDGFDTIVVGRRGVAMWREFAFGGTTEDLLRYPIGRNLWIIEPEPSTSGLRDLLIGIDGSDNGMRAVDYVANTLGSSNVFNVTLAHVPRRRTPEDAQHILDEAYDRLRNKGFPPERLETRILDPSLKTADALVKDARDNDRETIVIGRRGRSTIREFIFGGITERLLRYPIGHSVWIVD
jgi:nucleotide-binding universal stress UspA family protein